MRRVTITKRELNQLEVRNLVVVQSKVTCRWQHTGIASMGICSQWLVEHACPDNLKKLTAKEIRVFVLSSVQFRSKEN